MILDILPLYEVNMDEIIEQNETNAQDETPSFQILPEEKPEEISGAIIITGDIKGGKVFEKYNEITGTKEDIQLASCCTISTSAPTILSDLFFLFLAALAVFTIIEYFELRSKKAEHPFRTALLEALIACIIVIAFCAIVACCFMYFA